jgi:RHS repeat-associated protein
MAMADDAGAIKTTYVYDAFGKATATGETSDNPFQYTARENDGTGLYYYRARYYSPEMQRFISEDPIRLSGGINYHIYTQNNPVNLVDPTGKYAIVLPLVAFSEGTKLLLVVVAATAICYAIPECRKNMTCLGKLIADLAICVGKGICPSGEEKMTEHCMRRALLNYRACIRGWNTPPFPNVYPQ